MAEMTIRLRCDPITGKKDILVGLKSDEDALPLEHEQQHKLLVEKLIQGGFVKAGEVGEVIIDRAESEGKATVAEQKTGEVPQGHRLPEHL